MKNFILFVLLITPVFLFSQEYITINGKVIDSSTGKPLSFASVSVKGASISNISNADGVFSLKIPDNISNKDSLIISYIGFNNSIYPISDFLSQKIYSARLFPSNSNIKSVVVRPSEASKLFDQVFSSYNIKNNYPQSKTNLLGFYREIIKKGNKHITLNEAILDIDKSSYGSYGNDILSIYKGRGTQNIKNEDTLFIKFQGGPISMMYMDLIKNSFIGCELLFAHTYYDFQLEPSVYKNGENIYVLKFNQKDTISDIMFRGKLYVSSESLALIRAEFSMNIEDNKYAWKEFIKKKPDNCDIIVDKADYVVNYKKFNDKWYYDYARFELGFSAKYKGKWVKNKYSIVSELAITDFNNNIVAKPNSSSKLRYKDIMASKVQDFADSNFWGSYNIIEPDDAIENIINRIIRQLKRRDN